MDTKTWQGYFALKKQLFIPLDPWRTLKALHWKKITLAMLSTLCPIRLSSYLFNVPTQVYQTTSNSEIWRRRIFETKWGIDGDFKDFICNVKSITRPKFGFPRVIVIWKVYFCRPFTLKNEVFFQPEMICGFYTFLHLKIFMLYIRLVHSI